VAEGTRLLSEYGGTTSIEGSNPSLSVRTTPVRLMDLETAIRTRRTHRAYAPRPVERELLLELFDLARWAPNHHVTNPWRFRVLGPHAHAALAGAAEREAPGSARKLDRGPTLVVASVKLDEDLAQREEDLFAGAVAAYIVLLAAHGKGLAGYWRTLPVLDSEPLRAQLGIGEDERPIGLLHLGYGVQEQRVPERAPVEQFVEFLR
jgi:nitroreductase